MATIIEKTINHTMKKWFDETTKTPIEYFESTFNMNRIGKFKVPASTAKRFSDTEMDKIFNALGQSYIELILKLKPKLRMIPFDMLEKKDRETLRQLICEQIQYSVMNRQIMQIVNASNISTGSFTMNVDTTPWAFTSDMLSMRGRNLLQNSELDLYDIVDEGVIYQESKNGNIKVLRKIEGNDIPAIVWDTL